LYTVSAMNEQNLNRKYLLEEYRSRINRVMDYVEQHISRDLTLKALADVAGFSQFHFHRIFSGMVGETLYGFIQRIRLEKAASKLVQNPKKSITEIGLECGFTSSSAFARAFREKYGISASGWRSGSYKEYSKNGITDSKAEKSSGNPRQDFSIYPTYTQNKQQWRVEMKKGTMKADIEVREMPEITAAYVRHIGPYKGNPDVFQNLFNRLMMWAGPRGLMSQPDIKAMCIYYDDPEITDDSKLRIDACISVPKETKVDGEVGKTVIPAGKYAVGHFELGTQEYQSAWDAIYSNWLPQSGYQPADGPCYELYLSEMEDESKKHKVDIYVPVKPL